MRIVFLFQYATTILGTLILCLSQVDAADYTYQLTWLSPNTHTYVIEMKVAPQTGSYTEVAIPAWRPGRYFLQDYSAAVSHFEAMDADGEPLKWRKTNLHTWRVEHSNLNLKSVTVRYRYFANQQDAGSSYLAEDEMYFNPINLFMYVPGNYEGDVELSIPNLPSSWKAATALKKTAANTYTASSYHEFADSPTVFSPRMEQFSFQLDQTTFYVHFQGDYQGDASTQEPVIQALSMMCREQAAIFGEFPFDEYHFIYRLLPSRMRHAVEHSRSASFALPSNITKTPEKTVSGIIGISSHEFWHVWNVKRIRPAALWPYDYSAPQFTSLHWFTEGVTSYYTNLILLRAGLITEKSFLSQQSNTIESLENKYAASVVSPSASSFNSWLDTSPYAHPDHRVSYYTLGHRVGLLLDLSLRKQTNGETSLDDVFQFLYRTYYKNGKGVPEDGVQQAVEALTETSWQDFFDKYVHGTASADYVSLFDAFGLDVNIGEVRPSARAMGIQRSEYVNQGLLVRRVASGSDAYSAGLGPNDLILEVDGQKAGKIDLDEYLEGVKQGQEIRMKVINRLEIRDVVLTYQAAFAPRKYRLSLQDKPKKQQRALWEGWISSRQD